MLKVWISGANGHLGQALCTRLDREKYQLIATDVAEVDVTVPAEVRAFADANRPDVIINCTGFNDEDGCETDPDRAYRVNALAPRNLALAADALGRAKDIAPEVAFIHAREKDCHTLLDLLGLAQPSEEQVPKEDFDTPAALLDEMVELAAAKGLFDGSVPQYRINFETRMMGALMPRESEVCRKFRKLYAKGGPKAATDWFYDLCVVSNYIRTAQIAKNIQWNTATPYGELEITINLTKPEKDPKVIAMERLQPAASYPKCMLCKLCGAHQLPCPPDPSHCAHKPGR